MANGLDNAADTTVLVCGPDLKATAPPVEWTSIDATLRNNEVSSGSFTAQADAELVNALTADDARVVVIHEDQVLISGPVEVPEEVWVRDGLGQITAGFSDHLSLIAGELAWPNPALPLTGQDRPFWTATGAAETLMRDLVNVNVGPGALVARRIPGLTLATSGSAGLSVAFKALPFEKLGEALRRIALAGGGLTFGIRQVGRGLVFDADAIRDRSQQVRYSIQLGNVDGLVIRREAPTATVAVVGHLSDDDPPIVREVVNTPALDAWGRREVWVSVGDDATEAEIAQAGNEALADGAPKIGVVVTGADGPGQHYGVDYLVGDYVGVELGNRQTLKEIVTQVHVAITPREGAKFTPKIGTGDVVGSTATSNAIRAMDRRIGRLLRS